MISSGVSKSKFRGRAAALALACAVLALLAQIVVAGWRAPPQAMGGEKAGITAFVGKNHVICLTHGHGSTPADNQHKDCDDCPLCHGQRLADGFPPPVAAVLPIPVSSHIDPPQIQSSAPPQLALLRRVQPRGPPRIA